MEQLTKEIIEDAVKSALLDFQENRNAIDNSDNIISSADDLSTEMSADIDANPALDANETVDEMQPADVVTDEIDVTPEVTEEVVEVNGEVPVEDTVAEVETTDVDDGVAEVIEESIEDSGKYNIFGIDITVNKNDNGKYDVVLKSSKEDCENTIELETVDTQTLFDAVQDFMNTIVLQGTDEAEDSEELESEEDSKTADEDVEAEDVEMDEDNEETSDEDIDDTESEEDEDDKVYAATMSSYMSQYGDELDAIFAQGLAAKKLALDMVKDKILASTVQELSSKMKANEGILASKQNELKQAKLKYLMAKKMDMQYDNMYTIIAQGIADIADGISNSLISADIAKKAIKRYNTIVSNVINTNNPALMDASIKTITKINGVVASAKENAKNKRAIISNIHKEEQQNKPVLKPQNILNYDTFKGGRPLIANRQADIANEMIAEIVKMSGIEE